MDSYACAHVALLVKARLLTWLIKATRGLAIERNNHNFDLCIVKTASIIEDGFLKLISL